MVDKLLLVGEISKIGVEILETAYAAGFQPIVVALEGQSERADLETWRIDNLPSLYRSLPAAVARSPERPDLTEVRIDRRLTERFLSLLDTCALHGIVNWVPLVHPSAVVSPSAELGAGVVVGPLVTISSQTKIGMHSRVGRSSTIGHDVSIGPHCRIGPAVSIPGNVVVHEQTMVGIGSTFIGGVEIGPRSLIGAGSVVTKSFPAGSQLWGNPARLT